MRKTLVVGVILAGLALCGWQLAVRVQASPEEKPALSMGCSAGEQADKPVVTVEKKTTEAKENKMSHREKILRERYAEISTMPSTILVTVKDENSGEVATIVCDHAYWCKTNKRVKHDELSQKEYEDLMIAQGDKPFVVDSETFAKFKKLSAPEPSAQMRALSMDEIAERYLTKPQRRNGAWGVKDPETLDKTFVRLLLEKGCVINYSCLDGSPMIKW